MQRIALLGMAVLCLGGMVWTASATAAPTLNVDVPKSNMYGSWRATTMQLDGATPGDTYDIADGAGGVYWGYYGTGGSTCVADANGQCTFSTYDSFAVGDQITVTDRGTWPAPPSIVVSTTVPSIAAGANRADDTVSGRLTPNSVATVTVAPGGGVAPPVSVSETTDGSGWLYADFGASSAQPAVIDPHADVAVQVADANGNTWTNHLALPYMRVFANQRTVCAYDAPSTGATVALIDAQGNLLDSQPLVGCARFKNPIAPGTTAALDVASGVQVLTMKVPAITSNMDVDTRHVTGSATSLDGGVGAWNARIEVGALSVPGASGIVSQPLALAADGSFADTAPAEPAARSDDDAGVVSVVLADALGDEVVSQPSLPRVTMTVTTGAVTMDTDGDEAAYVLRVLAPSGTELAHTNVATTWDPVRDAFGGSFRAYMFTSVPRADLAPGNVVRLERAGDVVGHAVVPAGALAFNTSLGSADFTTDAGQATITDVRDLQRYPGDAETQSADCTTTSGHCSVTFTGDARPSDKVTAVTAAPGTDGLMVFQFPALVPDVAACRLAVTPQIALVRGTNAPVGSDTVAVTAPDGSTRQQATTSVGGRKTLDLTLAGGPLAPQAGDTVTVTTSGGAVACQMVVGSLVVHADIPGARFLITGPPAGAVVAGTEDTYPNLDVVDPGQYRWRSHSLQLDATGSAILAGSPGDDERAVMLDAAGNQTVGYAGLPTVTVDDAHDDGSAGASVGVSVDGVGLTAQSVDLVRGGTQLASLSVDPHHDWVVMPIAGAALPLRVGDRFVVHTLDGDSSLTIPAAEAYEDISGQRVVGVAPLGVTPTVVATSSVGWTASDTWSMWTQTDGNGHWEQQFGTQVGIGWKLTADTAVQVQLPLPGGTFEPRVSKLALDVDQDTRTVRVDGLASGAHRLRLQCDKSVRQVLFTSTDTVESTVAGKTLLAGGGQWGGGCTLSVTDGTGASILDSVVPGLSAWWDPGTANVYVRGPVGAQASVDFAGSSTGDVAGTIPAGGTGVTPIPAGAASAVVRLVDATGVTWHLVASVTKLPAVPHGMSAVIAPQGATLGGTTFGPAVTTPPNTFVGNVVTLSKHDQPVSNGAQTTMTRAGFAAASAFAQVDIKDIASLQPLLVRGLDVPIKVDVPIPATTTLPDSALAPAWFSNTGAWSLVPQIVPGYLPPGQPDGYWVEHAATGRIVHLLTRHLTEFGVLHDARVPAWAMGSVRETSTPGAPGAPNKLAVTWKPATDNVGVTSYLVYVGGRSPLMLAPAARTIPYTPEKPGSRIPPVVCLVATDAGLNRSQPQCVTMVPGVTVA
jgi:hypothetical protein